LYLRGSPAPTALRARRVHPRRPHQPRRRPGRQDARAIGSGPPI